LGHYQADDWAEGGGKDPTGIEMDKGKAKDAMGVAKAKEEEENDKSECGSEGQSNDESVEEEDVSMQQLMDPSILEESQVYEYKPTSVFTQATMPMPPPSSQPHLVPSYLTRVS
jgi:hypothetical protein